MKVIETENLCRCYRKGPQIVKAVNGINFSAGEKEFIGITGISGSGKSTLLGLLGFLDRPTEGTIRFMGRPVSTGQPAALASFRRKNIGYIFQKFYLTEHLSALENTALPLKYDGVSRERRNKAASEILEKVGLGARKHFRPAELSGGESQRVAIARAIANSPSLLLADEPTSELDSATGREILQLIAELETTVIIVTHDPAVLPYCSRVYRMEEGKLFPAQSAERGINAGNEF